MTVPDYTTDGELIPDVTSRLGVIGIRAALVMWRYFPPLGWIPMFFIRHIRLEPLAAGVHGVLAQAVIYLNNGQVYVHSEEFVPSQVK